MATDIEVIKQFYSGLNSNDIESAIKLFDENIIRNEFEGTPIAGAYQGLTEMRKNLISGRSTWAEGSCEPIEFISSNGKTVVIVHVKVRVKNNTTWIDAKVADGFSLKAGLVTEFHSFLDKEKALIWMG